MNTIELENSSEEDNDIYLNSVACLKALKSKTITNYNVLRDNNNTEQSKTNTIKRVESNPRRKRGRKKQKCTEDSYVTYDLTEDLETASVKDNSEIILLSDEDVICTRSRAKNRKKTNNSIVSNCRKEIDLEKDENFDVNVKILWRSKGIHRLNLHKHDNFKKIFQYFADMENVSIEQILIMKKDKRINLTDTPSSLGLSIIDILEGGIVDANIISESDYQNQQNTIEDDICQIKVQTANKQSLVIPLRKNQPFQILITSCAREWNVNESNINLYFDGDPINNSDTPESLDLEQEACIDLRITKK